MDSALRDPHNGSTQTPSPAHGTTRPPSTPQGIALAYGSLLLMALLPIFFGALRSVRCARGKSSSDMPETITSRDAARFPIIASCTLLGLYLFFKIFSQEYINLLLSMYFFVLGILALSHTISPFMNKFFPANFPNRQYQLLFTQGSGENKEAVEITGESLLAGSAGQCSREKRRGEARRMSSPNPTRPSIRIQGYADANSGPHPTLSAIGSPEKSRKSGELPEIRRRAVG
ncbi:hypothetical protein NN561_009834 [Cricetulus griseus]